MFIGHYGLALASKKTGAAVKLGTALLAAQFLDLLWPIFSLAGLEKFSIEPGNTKLTPLNFEHYPYTHSLLGSIVLALLFATVYFFFKKDFRNAVVYALLVFSHWVLDYITHRPDLPLTYTSTEKFGLGLWNFPAAAIIIESLIFVLGIYFYFISTKAVNKKGRVLIWVMILLLTIFYIMNLIGPTPPSTAAVSYSALLLWLFVFMGYWIDKNRVAL
jgi:membrane-bound metal-dependent hydrolase YbcI (DUF457 family)